MVKALAAASAVLALALGAHAANGGPEVTMPDKFFAPGELDVLVGQTVTWQNTDSRSHTVTSDTDVFDSGFVTSGSSFSHRFPAAGTFAYRCRIHRSMRGIVRAFALIFTGPPRPLPPGWAVSFRGVAPAAGDTVVLERLGRGATGVARTTAGEDGGFVFTQRPTSPGAYRARAGNATSPILRVAVKPSVAVDISRSHVLVSTTPGRPRSAVALQLYDRGRFDWVTVHKGRLDDASRTTIALPGRPLRGRIVVRGREGWADGVSRTFVLR